MPFFTNCEIEIYEYNETSETDEDGEPIVKYIFTGLYPADFQNQSLSAMQTNGSIQLESGKILTDLYKVYLDKDVPVSDKAILKIKDKPDTYTILGSPLPNEHNLGLGHLKLTLQKERFPRELPAKDDFNE